RHGRRGDEQRDGYRDGAGKAAREDRRVQRPDRRRSGDGGNRIEQRRDARSRAPRSRGAVLPMTSEPIEVGSVPRARSSAVLTHEGGLHARPAIKLTQLAKRFESAVWISLAE